MLIRQSPEPARVQGEADLTVSSLGLSLIPLSTVYYIWLTPALTLLKVSGAMLLMTHF